MSESSTHNKIVRITDIDWDIDSDEEISEEELKKIKNYLPEQCTMLVDHRNEDLTDEEIIDILSDDYGWCIKSCWIRRE